MYDRKIAAENAMKKVSSAFDEKKPESNTNPPEYEPYKYEGKSQKEEKPVVADISTAVDEFIKSFGQEEKKPVRKPQNVHPVQTTVKSNKIASKPSGRPAAKKEGVKADGKKKKAAQPVKKQKPVTPVKQERTVLVRNEERSDLMDDYRKIMMDEDEDKLSLKEKLALKKKEKEEKKENKKAEKIARMEEKKKAEEQIFAAESSTEEKEQIPQTEVSAIDIEKAAAEILESVTEPVAEKEEEYIPAHAFTGEEPAAYDEEAPVYEETPEVLTQEEVYIDEADIELEDNTDDYETDREAYLNRIYPETEMYSEEEYVEEQYSEEEYDEDYYENEEEEYGNYNSSVPEQVIESFIDDEPVKVKSSKGKVFSLILFILVFILTGALGVLRYVVGVDTGKAFMQQYYVFTAEEDYLFAGINKGDLILTQKGNIVQQDAFVYYDNSARFRVAQLSDTGSLTNTVIIAKNDSEQIFTATENVRGVVKLTVPFAGTVIGFAMDNFLAVLGVMVALCFVLIILTAVLFRRGMGKRQLESEYSIDDEYYDEENYEAVDEQNYDAYEEETEAMTQEETTQNEEIPVEETKPEEGLETPFYEISEE